MEHKGLFPPGISPCRGSGNKKNPKKMKRKAF
jgi:hypothetical protein